MAAHVSIDSDSVQEAENYESNIDEKCAKDLPIVMNERKELEFIKVNLKEIVGLQTATKCKCVEQMNQAESGSDIDLKPLQRFIASQKTDVKLQNKTPIDNPIMDLLHKIESEKFDDVVDQSKNNVSSGAKVILDLLNEDSN